MKIDMQSYYFWITTSNQGDYKSLFIKWAKVEKDNCINSIYSDKLATILPVYKQLKSVIFNHCQNLDDKLKWANETWLGKIIIKDDNGRDIPLEEALNY